MIIMIRLDQQIFCNQKLSNKYRKVRNLFYYSLIKNISNKAPLRMMLPKKRLTPFEIFLFKQKNTKTIKLNRISSKFNNNYMLELEEESKFHFVDQQQQQKKINTKKNYQLTQEDLKPKRLLTTILQNSKVLFTTEQTITKTHNDNNNEQYNIHNQDNQFGKKIIKYKQFIVPKKLPTTILHSQRVNSTTNKQKMLNKNRNSQIRRLSNEESYSVRRNRSCTPILHKKYKHFLRFIEKTNKANSARNVKKNNKNNNSCYVNILQSNNYTRFNIKQNNSNNQKDQEEYYNLSKMYDSKYTTWKEQEKHKPNSKLLSSRSRRNAEKWNGGDKVQPWEQHNYNNYNIQENYCW